MNRHAATTRAAAVALLATGLAVVPVSAAPAATGAQARVGADWAAQSIVFTAAAGQANDLHVIPMEVGSGVRQIGFRDAVPITPGDHCAYLDPGDHTFVVCELPTGRTARDRIDVFLGDRDDTIVTSDPAVDTVRGGAGDDELHAHTARTVRGDAGNDMVMGLSVLDGGDGMDHLMGDDGDQRLRGGRGEDMIEAYGGADLVSAGPDDDHVLGGDGRDVLLGGAGDDTLNGEGGDDLVDGGPGRDTLEGGPGRDIVLR
ncbi:hemolysin-type calcium-binding protein [Streptomyces alfalfae]|uniref:Calcium-binding protein n=1 Tax=Streptomyces alfalfae TaxID=1642299 RepID=A0A1P8TRJ9_9ACTN|nr:calcium-binding protein [Streptomyces alfalfae]AYA20710.1 calcium-binding protein [Streptomyces fradiae]APY90251.1 hemolysin-type calcium-binding protein [Streptomyces alfalfae]QQC87229.1 calcium-binding protein [Streptomyces alfalfae]QUI29668.1 calcium-binding protein [Streptomyces alfalfae]RXX34917.1 hemolysin-type calcium-binding protein [Streptomyces alfalfae]